MTAIATGHAHIKVSLSEGVVSLERCEDGDCLVGDDGHAGCGRLACPSCGCSGVNLSVAQETGLLDGERVLCSCGHAWQMAA